MSPACWSAEPVVLLDANSVVSSMLTFAVTPAGHTSLARAASNFSLADLPAPFVSQASSSPGARFLKAASACLMWHLIAAAQAFPKLLRLPSEHLRSSLVAGAHPGSSPPIGSPGAA